MFRRKKQNKLMTRLITAAGAVSAIIGVRALMRWMGQRSDEEPYSYRAQERMPVTGVTSMGRTEEREESAGSYKGERPFEGTPPTEGAPSVEGERDRASIPSTGMLSEQVVDRPRAQDRMEETAFSTGVETDQPVPVGSLVGPFIVHLLSFHNMINMLEQRRDAAANNVVSDTYMPDARAGGADAVDSLEAQLPEFDRSALVRGSLQARIFEMMDRIREVLQNTDYSEEQLFKIKDEVRPAVCKILDLIHKEEEDFVTGFEDVRKAYACR